MRKGYYSEQMRTDERLAAMMKGVQKRVLKGEQWAKGQKDGIAVGRELKAHGLSSNWAGFVKSYDYSKRITESRISKKRHEWQEREAVRMALQNPARAARVYGLPAPEAPRSAAVVLHNPVKVEAEPRPLAQPCEARLTDWAFTSGAKGLRLRWQVRDKGQDVPFYTTHALEPQVYAYGNATNESGQVCVKRTYLRGDFKNGALTKAAQVRIVEEGRAQVEKAFPALTLERYKDSLATMAYLMR